jgi:hypothetical protein
MSSNSIQSPTGFCEIFSKSVERPVEFHGTSPRSSREIIHVISLVAMNIMQMSQPVTAILQPTTTPQPNDAAEDNHSTTHAANNNTRPPVHHDRPNNEDGRPQTRTTAQMTMNTPKWTTPIHHGSQTMASAHEETQGTMGPGKQSSPAPPLT